MGLIRFLLVVGISAALAVSILFYIFVKPQGNDLLLSGPPEFIMLAIIVAFGAYLRQVSLYAAELRDRLIHGDVWNFPRGEEYTEAKIAEAENISNTIRLVSPFMILMILGVCARIVFDSAVRILCARGKTPPLLYCLTLCSPYVYFLDSLGSRFLISRPGAKMIAFNERHGSKKNRISIGQE